MKRFVKNVALVLLVWLLFIILCLVIPPAFHKRATPEDWLNDIRYEHTAPERVRSIDDNSDALLWRLRLIEEAKERIILTTFDFWDEESGQDVIGALWAAAERGVRVQVLLDGINGGHFLPMSRNLCQTCVSRGRLGGSKRTPASSAKWKAVPRCILWSPFFKALEKSRSAFSRLNFTDREHRAMNPSRPASPQSLAMANAKRTYSQYPGAISTPAERTASTKRDKLSDM